MGIFDVGAKKEQLTEEIKDKMKGSELVRLLCHFGDNEWVYSAQGYDDTGKRKVIIAPNLLYIYRLDKNFRIKFNEESGEFIEESETSIANDVYLHFSALGYRPLTAHLNEKGREDLTIGKMLFLLGSAIRERMQDMYPSFKFSDISETCYIQGKEYVAFTYEMPRMHLEEWI